MKRASFWGFVAIACAAILSAPAVRAQGYQFLQRNCPSCAVVFSSLSASTVTASTSVQTPVINGAGGVQRIALPSAGTTTIMSTQPTTGSAVGNVIDTTQTYAAGDKIFSWRTNGAEQAYLSGTGGFFVTGALRPVTVNAEDLGAASDEWRNLFIRSVKDSSNNTRLTFGAGSTPITYSGAVGDSAAAVAHKFGNSNALSTAGAHIAEFYSDNFATLKLSIDKDGSVIPATSNSATLGASNLGFAGVYVGSVLDITGTTRITVSGGSGNANRSAVADGAAAIAHEFRTKNALSTTGAKALQIDSDDGTTAQAYLIKDANGWNWRVEGRPVPTYNATGANAKTTLAGFISLTAGSASGTFSTAFAASPVCVCTDSTANASVKCAATTTTLNVTGTGTDSIAWFCIGDR
jgi:hypothetical protein